MSTIWPHRSKLRARPPTCGAASRTWTGMPESEREWAAVRPAGPAPMMTTWGVGGRVKVGLADEGDGNDTAALPDWNMISTLQRRQATLARHADRRMRPIRRPP